MGYKILRMLLNKQLLIFMIIDSVFHLLPYQNKHNKLSNSSPKEKESEFNDVHDTNDEVSSILQ